MNTTLDALSPGERGTIVTVRGESPVAQRLAELGMVAGMEVEMIRRAPLGDPLEVRIHSYLLSLRKAEARMVELTVGSRE